MGPGADSLPPFPLGGTGEPAVAPTVTAASGAPAPSDASILSRLACPSASAALRAFSVVSVLFFCLLIVDSFVF